MPRAIAFVIIGLLWVFGLRLFLTAPMAWRRKLAWSGLLLVAGVGIGLLLSGVVIVEKMMIVLILVPLMAIADVLLMDSRRGVLFWIRACGFELGSVFGVAALTRWLADLAGWTPVLS